jgi:hypothetical protein
MKKQRYYYALIDDFVYSKSLHTHLTQYEYGFANTKTAFAFTTRVARDTFLEKSWCPIDKAITRKEAERYAEYNTFWSDVVVFYTDLCGNAKVIQIIK